MSFLHQVPDAGYEFLKHEIFKNSTGMAGERKLGKAKSVALQKSWEEQATATFQNELCTVSVNSERTF